MQFTVTAEDLNSFASYCDLQRAAIGDSVKTLSNQVQELCSAPYVGPASGQLMEDMMQVSLETLRMDQVMADITTNLRHNALVYIDGETRNVSNLQAATAAISAAKNAVG